MSSIIQWSPGVKLEDIERQVVMAAYSFYKHNKTATSNALGIAVNTLNAKLEKYGADDESEKERADNDRTRNQDWLNRSRNGHPAAANAKVVASEKSQVQRVQNHTGARVESAAQPAAQPAVSVSERKEIQGVPQGQAAKGHPGRAR